MLINTVVLFLRDLLPLFIFICYLKATLESQVFTLKYQLISVVFGILVAALLFIIAEPLSEFFEGRGSELTKVLLLIIFYLSMLVVSIKSELPSLFKKLVPSTLVAKIAAVSFVSLIAVNGSSFLIFLDVYLQLNMSPLDASIADNQALNVVIGFVVGLGICVSFSVLFLFILRELKQLNKLWLVKTGLFLFIAGQFSYIVSQLTQIDMLSAGYPVVNFSQYIQDSSEYGHILHALIGFETSPSFNFLLVYFISFLLPILLLNTLRFRLQSQNKIAPQYKEDL
ncbi:hypothetical protein [uncultured Psychrosphaera sp.]|uniref:hypothetical protein n=1 Tax=uncultured Psychrosphaera sp. TaxID=1403522 RepID=UPI002624C08C|nr:hypothetical protein [uncultured Psychrosphaera sp.]